MKNLTSEKCYKLFFYTKLGKSNWVLTKKQFSDNEKEFKTLAKKAKIAIDLRNKSNLHRICKVTLHEFIDNKWTEIEQYPNDNEKAR